MFTIYDVDYYPAVSIGEIPQILNHGYCYLLYDFGVLTETNYNEFLRCDRKIVIGSLAPWKEQLLPQIYSINFYRAEIRGRLLLFSIVRRRK